MSKDVTVSGGWGRESHPLEQRSFLSLSHCRCPPWLGWAGAPPPTSRFLGASPVGSRSRRG